jgi:DNA-binding NtrC family response regulator
MPDTAYDAGTGAGIAFLDNDPEFLELIHVWQWGDDEDALTTQSLDECIRWLEAGRVHTIVCDLDMVGIDGVTALERMRAVSPRVTLYLLTGYTPGPDARRRLEAINAQVATKQDNLHTLLTELSSATPDDQATHVVKQQERIERLEAMEREWMLDLTEELASVPNPESVAIAGAPDGTTVAQLLDDVRQRTPRGRELMRLWNQTRRTLRKAGKWT